MRQVSIVFLALFLSVSCFANQGAKKTEVPQKVHVVERFPGLSQLQQIADNVEALGSTVKTYLILNTVVTGTLMLVSSVITGCVVAKVMQRNLPQYQAIAMNE